MPKTFKGYPPGVDPKSVRVVRRAGTAPRSTFMQDLGFTSKNMIKTRFVRGWHDIQHCCFAFVHGMPDVTAVSSYKPLVLLNIVLQGAARWILACLLRNSPSHHDHCPCLACFVGFACHG